VHEGRYLDVTLLAGTASQIAGTTVIGRGMPADSPWPDDRARSLGWHVQEVD
jgi:hypothetical protein